MTKDENWKSAFYNAYVSSGQAGPQHGETAVEFFRHRLAYLNHIVASHIPPDRNSRIIDLGCGAGALLFVLQRAGFHNIAGVDVSPEQVEVAARLGVQSVSCGHLDDFLATQPAGTVDVVLAIDILEHLTRPQLMEALVSIRRILAPGGRCVAHVPNAEGIFGMAIRHGDFTHELAFTRSSASQIFRVAGFDRILCFEDEPLVHGLKSLVRRILWNLGTLPFRLLYVAESGASGTILSQNMMIEAHLGRDSRRNDV